MSMFDFTTLVKKKIDSGIEVYGLLTIMSTDFGMKLIWTCVGIYAKRKS